MAFKDKETGKWVAQWYEPNVYGVNKQKKKRGFKTQREAKQYECDRNLKKQGNLQMSMKVFVEQYFQDKENELKSRTKQNKRYMIDSYLIPYFGDMKMSDIKPAQIIAWQNEILKKTAEKQIADKKLEETYKEIKEADAVAQWGIKDIKEFENKVAKGPEEPKGLMSAKSYREKIVMPFLAGLNKIFKRIVKMAKSCFAESIELRKKLEQANEDRERLAEVNETLR